MESQKGQTDLGIEADWMAEVRATQKTRTFARWGPLYNNLQVRFLWCCEEDELIEFLDSDGAWRSGPPPVLGKEGSQGWLQWQHSCYVLEGPAGPNFRVELLRGAHPKSVPQPWRRDDGGSSRYEDAAAFGPEDAALRMALVKEWGATDDGGKWKWLWNENERWDEEAMMWVVPSPPPPSQPRRRRQRRRRGHRRQRRRLQQRRRLRLGAPCRCPPETRRGSRCPLFVRRHGW